MTTEQEVARRRQLDAEELAHKNAAAPLAQPVPQFAAPKPVAVSPAPVAATDESPLSSLNEAEAALLGKLRDLNELRQLARKLNIKV